MARRVVESLVPVCAVSLQGNSMLYVVSFQEGVKNIGYPNHSSVLFYSMTSINEYRQTIIGNLNKLPG